VVRTRSSLELTVTDDGRGIPEEPASGVGLESMKERCQNLGGEFDVQRLTSGTRITARIPLESN
jgi:signal transduction histidine kinase